MKNLFHRVRNGLTEYSRNYRSVNPYLMMSYSGLPPFLCKLANILFIYIIKTKLYGEGAKTKGKNEDKRIYTDIELSLEDLLKDFNPIKYAEGKDIETDKSNMIKKIKELNDYNIFYHWKYNKKYLFIMEREIGCWRIFSDNGCVIPKTLKKIVKLAEDMIGCVVKFENKHGKADVKHIERSFGDFMNKMISKMNPICSSKLTLWSDEKEMPTYLVDISKQLHGMDEFDGLEFTEDEVDNFLQKIPSTIAGKIREEVRQENMKIKKEKELEKDLLPKNANLVKGAVVKVQGEKKDTRVSVGSGEPKLFRWKGEVDPLEDSRQFMEYYRHVLHSKTGGQVVFDPMAVDAISAAQILDLLLEQKRNKEFLDAWIQYFYDNNLKGQKALKAKYTSLKCFKDTFESYNETYYIPS